MDLETLKTQVEGVVKQESIKVLDEAIARLQALRAEYVGDERSESATPVPPPTRQFSPSRDTPPPAAKSQEPARMVGAAPVTAEPTICLQCRNQFEKEHNRQQICSDACRKERSKNSTRRWQQEHARESAGARTEKPAGSQYDPSTVDDEQWRAYGESVRAKLAKRPDALVFPKAA